MIISSFCDSIKAYYIDREVFDMIGSGLKKLARENGMKVAHGIAYGSLQGHAATMSEGSGFKRIVYTTKFADPQASGALGQVLSNEDIKKQYSLQSVTFGSQMINVTFTDGIGTMDKIRAFVAWFTPMLGQYGASPWNVCVECGGQVMNGRWIAISGVAYYMHETCAARVRQSIGQAEEQQKQTRTGSYGTGAIGAVLGAALGAVVWAIVLMAGYVAALVGLLIGWLADKGYGLLGGKQGKPKVAILIGAVIFGVIAGTVGGYCISLAKEMAQIGYTGGVLELFFWLLGSSEEFSGGVFGDLMLGLLFAGLGVFGMMRKANDEVSGTKIMDLK